MAKNFYITTTLPYVNADLHIGHALEFIRADTVARYKKLIGFNVFFNSGTDEHGMKIYEKACENGKEPKIFVEEAFERFRKQTKSFGMSEDCHFVRTTDKRHEAAAQAFWQKVANNGYIYKKNYQAKYCSGCEEEKTESELVNGKCPDHLNRELEIVNEENYFFAFSKFQKLLLDFYKEHPDFVIPQFRYNEVIAFVERGLQDFSISRLKTKMPWGIAVPGDEDQIMYVWFDALTNYISTLDWPYSAEASRVKPEENLFEKFWINGTPTQYCGKDNTRFQAIMWQAMLMAADLPNSCQIVVNGHITAEGGIKMSKSLGNVVDPKSISARYEIDALRYFLLAEISNFEDSPFSEERFKEVYNAKLANGLGNLTSRIMKMAQDNLGVSSQQLVTRIEEKEKEEMPKEYTNCLEKFEINKACEYIWGEISSMDKFIQENQPFKIVKMEKEKGQEMISDLVMKLYSIAKMLEPILPETSTKIKELIKNNKSPEKPLFVRKD